MSGASIERLAEGTVDIDRPCPDVFAYVANMENFAEWFPGVVAIRGQGPLDHAQVGKRYRETVRLPFGRTGTIDIEVKDVRAGTHLRTEGSGFLMPGMKVDFAALPDGRTRVEWRMESRNARWWFRWAIAPLLRRIMGRRARSGLRRLRDNLERSPS